MAQPLPYNREHNFVLDEEGVVNSQALNTEFDNASLSINKIRENLATIQNDDGSLRAGIVTLDVLSSDVVKDVAEATEKAAQSAAITLEQAVAASEKIVRLDESVTSNANSVALMKNSVDVSERNVSSLAAQVNEFSDELMLVADNITDIDAIGTNITAIQAVSNDLRGLPIYRFDCGPISEPLTPANGIGGVLQICAENIDIIREVAESLKNASTLMNLAEVVDEIGSTDYVEIDNTGNTGA